MKKDIKLPSDDLLSRRVFLKSTGGVALFIGVAGLFPQLISCSDTKKDPEATGKSQNYSMGTNYGGWGNHYLQSGR